MSTDFPIRLVLGFLLLNAFQVATPNLIAAQPPTLELKTEASTVGKVATVKPTILIAQKSPSPRRIRFARGASSAAIQNSVVRGTRDTYLLNAKAGQRMTVSISSVEENAVFDIIAPNQQTIAQDVTNSSVVLPARGDYRIVVGGTRGNATYKLRVAIK